MSARNYYVTNTDPAILKSYQEDYEVMGRDTKIEGNTLTVFALKQIPQVSKKKPRGKFTKKPDREQAASTR